MTTKQVSDEIMAHIKQGEITPCRLLLQDVLHEEIVDAVKQYPGNREYQIVSAIRIYMTFLEQVQETLGEEYGCPPFGLEIKEGE